MPWTVYGWRKRFLAGRHSSLDDLGASKQVRRHKKEITSLKIIIGEYAMANDVLKKRCRAGENECGVHDTGDGGPQQGTPAMRGVQEGVVLHLQTQQRIAGPTSARDGPKDLSHKTHVWHAAYGRLGI